MLLRYFKPWNIAALIVLFPNEICPDIAIETLRFQAFPNILVIMLKNISIKHLEEAVLDDVLKLNSNWIMLLSLGKSERQGLSK